MFKFLKRLLGLEKPEPKSQQSQSSSGEVTLTGDWQGHYTQHGSRHRLLARLTQQGPRFTGEMTDLDNVTVQSLFDFVADAGMQPGADEQLEGQIRQMLPEAGPGPITTRSILPWSSRLTGTVQGPFVRFIKTYDGEAWHGYEIDETGIGQRQPAHPVEYSGRLSPDGNMISGLWTIYHQDSSRGCIDGGFTLQRT